MQWFQGLVHVIRVSLTHRLYIWLQLPGTNSEQEQHWHSWAKYHHSSHGKTGSPEKIASGRCNARMTKSCKLKFFGHVSCHLMIRAGENIISDQHQEWWWSEKAVAKQPHRLVQYHASVNAATGWRQKGISKESSCMCMKASLVQISPKLHYTNIVANMLATPPTDETPTILQHVVGNNFTTNGQNFFTSQHLDM